MSNPAVLISIRPEWVGKILSGEKTVEIRKRKPYFEPPFKCYIYCTKGGDGEYVAMWRNGILPRRESYRANGTVCAEFTCDSIQNFSCPFPAYSKEVDQTILKDACIAYVWAHLYLGHKSGCAWHISDCKTYDEPKQITDFKRWNRTEDNAPCAHVKALYEPCETCTACNLSRPPQSWCYVEEI